MLLAKHYSINNFKEKTLGRHSAGRRAAVFQSPLRLCVKLRREGACASP